MSVRHGIALFLALCALTFLVACGGSSNRLPIPQPPPSGGFTNADLNGTYVFSVSGSDFMGGFLTVAGALVADGGGNITAGTIDVVGFNVILASPVAQPITGGVYAITADGRGQVKINTANGPISLDVVLTSKLHGLVTEFDGNGTGSGTIDLQTGITSLTQLAGSYAFTLGGVDLSGNAFATVGSFTLDQSGNITAGVQDFNDAAIPYTAVAINPTGPAILGSGTGPGTITIKTATFSALTFDFYAIDATHLKFIETDSLPILSGDVFSQTGASIPTGAMVFTLAGLVSNGSVAAGGVMTSDGTGNFTGGLEDINNAGVISSAQVPFTGTAVTGGSTVGGRVTVNLSGFVPVTQLAIYPFSGGVLMLETDSLGIMGGVAYAQTGTTVAASQGYGLNISGFNSGGEEDDIAEFTTTSSTFTGIVDLNDLGVLTFAKPLNGSFSATDASGRGSATSNYFTYVFYVVDNSTVLLLETDSSQVGTGVFKLQGSPAAAAKSAVVVSRPPMTAHVARAASRHH